MGEKAEGFPGTTIKDTWTKTRWGGNRGRRWGRLWGKGRKLYLNKYKNQKYLKKKKKKIIII